MQTSAQPARQAPDATIRARDLGLVLSSIKIRAFTKGHTCRLCALSETAMIQLSCTDGHRSRADAAKWGKSGVRVSPIQRGDIGALYERVNRERGRREVIATWGVGIRALRAEPRYTIDGGSGADQDLVLVS